jgi:hypothetical protein
VVRIIDDIENPRPPRDEAPPRKPPVEDAPPPQPTSAPLTADERKLAASIEQAYGMIGVTVSSVGLRLKDQGLIATGVKTGEMADALALAWIELARKNPKLKAYLKKMVEASAAGVLVGMHVMVLMPLLADRGIIPVYMAVTEDPEPPMGMNGNSPE